MKVAELREKLKDAQKETLEVLVVELYKKFSKAKKEDEIDDLIAECLASPGGKPVKKAAAPKDFEELKNEILDFTANAYAGYYFAPNRVIPKSQRSKWRFQVKQYVKQLENIPREDPHYRDSASLMTKLYKVLCSGCGVYLFSSTDPFRSVGISQEEFFGKVLSRSFGDGYAEETLREMLLLAATVNLDSYTIYLDLEAKFLAYLKTSDLKYTVLRLAREIVEEKEAERSKLKQYETRQYYVTSAIDEMCVVIWAISILLGEPEKEFQYFFRHYGGLGRRDRSVGLYVALEVVELFGDDALWIAVYEKARKAKIGLREDLTLKYEELKEKQTS